MKALVLLVLLAIGGWVGMGQAQAACSPTGAGFVNHTCVTFAEAQAVAQQIGAAMNQQFWAARCAGTFIAPMYTLNNAPTGTKAVNNLATGSGGCGGTWGTIVNTFSTGACPAGWVFNQSTGNCDQPCSAKPVDNNWNGLGGRGDLLPGRVYLSRKFPRWRVSYRRDLSE
jgi:hypothetical protein